MAGRKPKPTALKELAGNPGKRPLNKAEPRPPPGAPLPPAHLTKFARAEWLRLSTQLDLLQLLTNVDAGAFAAYCEAVSLWRRAKRIVQQKGLTFETNGMVRKRPEVAIMQEAARQVVKYATEFGLTPSSRSRVGAAMPAQPPLPGMDLPEQRDPAKPAVPTAGIDLSDDEFLSPSGSRH